MWKNSLKEKNTGNKGDTTMLKADMETAILKKFKQIRSVSASYGWTYETEFHTAVFTIYVKDRRLNGSNVIYIRSREEIKNPYTEANLKTIIEEFPALYKENKEKYKEWLKTSQGKEFLKIEKRTEEKNKVINFVKDSRILIDEHRAYHSGDTLYYTVLDLVKGKKELSKYHATGDFLAVVQIERVRTYSKAYTRQFGPGKRYDKYLVGSNEIGTKFVHPVPDKIGTVKSAINWIWDDNEIVARQGDVAITPSKTIKNKVGEKTTIRIIDSHMFSGEVIQNGSTYVRNGMLFHEKQQHPEIFVEDQWMKILVGKRFHKVASRGGTAD